MKHVLLMAFALMMGLQAKASVSTDEFVSIFVAQMNRRLVYMNQDRITVGKRPYCTGLNAQQITLIKEAVAANPDQTVGNFLESVADPLKCYPVAWPPLKREGWGVLVNTKAFWMDIDLILQTLKDLRQGRYVDNRQKLLDIFDAQDYETTEEF